MTIFGYNTRAFRKLSFISLVRICITISRLQLLQFRGDLVLWPKAEDREVVDEIIASGRPVRQDGVIGSLYGAALKLPLGIQVAVQAIANLALVVQCADAVGLQGQYATIVTAIERRDCLQFLEMQIARRSRASSLQITAVDERCRLTDR